MTNLYRLVVVRTDDYEADSWSASVSVDEMQPREELDVLSENLNDLLDLGLYLVSSRNGHLDAVMFDRDGNPTHQYSTSASSASPTWHSPEREVTRRSPARLA